MSEKPKFATPFAMKCNKEQFESVKEKLTEIGRDIYKYIESFEHNCYLFFTATGRVDNMPTYEAFKTHNVVIKKWNEDLCLALAAMIVAKEYHPGEWICNKEGDFVKISAYFEKSLNWRKATKEELINHFMPKVENDVDISLNPLTVPELVKLVFDQKQQGKYWVVSAGACRIVAVEFNNGEYTFTFEKDEKMKGSNIYTETLNDGRIQPIKVSEDHMTEETIWNDVRKAESKIDKLKRKLAAQELKLHNLKNRS